MKICVMLPCYRVQDRLVVTFEVWGGMKFFWRAFFLNKKKIHFYQPYRFRFSLVQMIVKWIGSSLFMNQNMLPRSYTSSFLNQHSIIFDWLKLSSELLMLMEGTQGSYIVVSSCGIFLVYRLKTHGQMLMLIVEYCWTTLVWLKQGRIAVQLYAFYLFKLIDN